MTSENGDIYIKVGACGSTVGSSVQDWDDGFHLAIRHIYLCYSENSINCIQVAYFDPSKGTVLSPKHGNTVSTDFFEEINISPHDPIISVGGYFKTDGCNTIKTKQLLTSLKFVTVSGKTYGPYGMNASGTISKCKSFCFTTTSGVRGFHGSSNGSSLCSIGIYVESQASSVPLIYLNGVDIIFLLI